MQICIMYCKNKIEKLTIILFNMKYTKTSELNNLKYIMK